MWFCVEQEKSGAMNANVKVFYFAKDTVEPYVEVETLINTFVSSRKLALSVHSY